MLVKLAQIDAFTDRPFSGNPAAVCLLEEFPEASEMQRLAREMNLSETAFLRPVLDEFELRWFTPTVEVELCGHATLASAHHLWSEGILEAGQEAVFRTRSGRLSAARNGSWIEMNFPAQPAAQAPAPAGLLRALGVQPRFVGRNTFDWIVEVATEKEVRQLTPDLGVLGRICSRGIMVTSRGTSPEYDFVSRFFAPAVGVDEDPVTGSAHCCLAPFWAERLGRFELIGFQASERGGVVRVLPRGDRVILAGQAVTVLQCELQVPWPTAT